MHLEDKIKALGGLLGTLLIGRKVRANDTEGRVVRAYGDVVVVVMPHCSEDTIEHHVSIYEIEIEIDD